MNYVSCPGCKSFFTREQNHMEGGLCIVCGDKPKPIPLYEADEIMRNRYYKCRNCNSYFDFHNRHIRQDRCPIDSHKMSVVSRIDGY
jgi:hypothetical protein